MAEQEVIQTPNLPAVSEAAQRFELQQRQASTFAASALVPDNLRKGDRNTALANCYIALTMAEAMGELPIIVMQNIHIVNGKAGFSSQYMIARANASGRFDGGIDWRIDRSDPKNLTVTAFATRADTGQEVSVTVDMAMAEAEGWTKNPKYRSMPEIMLRYRSAAFLVRFYAPDVMLGYQTAEEVEDVVIAGGPDLNAQPLTAEMLVEQSRPQGEQVDTQTTAATDAEAEPVEEPKPEPPQTDHTGPKPENAQHGESWFDAEAGKVRYAHQTEKHGIKWYVEPPQGPAPQEQTQAEAAEDTAKAIDGPLEQGDPGPQGEEEPRWKSECRAIHTRVTEAVTASEVASAEADWLNKVRNGVPEGEQVIANIEKAIAAAKTRVKGEG